MSILKGAKNEIWQTCTAELPTDKSKNLIVNFEVLFNRLKKSDYQALLEDYDGKNGRLPLSDGVRQHVKNWKLKGEENVEVPFTEEYLDEVFEDIDYTNAIINGFMEVHIRKFKELTRKN